MSNVPAYVVDNAVAAYVYGPHYHTSVRDLAANTKTEAEQQRWERLCSYKQCWSTRDVIGTTGVVRSLRFETVHGNAQQHTSTTVDQLQTWARQLLQVREAALVGRLLGLAQLFSEANMVLVCAAPEEVAERVEAALQAAAPAARAHARFELCGPCGKALCF